MVNASEIYNTVFINGEVFNFLKSMSLYDILVYLNFDVSRVVVEYNSKIVLNRQFNSLWIEDNDRLEVVTIVGGG